MAFSAAFSFIEGGIVVRELIQELIDHRHVVPTHDRLGKGVGGNFLRCQHIPYSPPLKIQPVVLQLVDQIAFDIHVVGR